MTVLFAGSDINSFVITSVTNDTNSAHHLFPATTALSINSAGSARIPLGPQSDYWLHFDIMLTGIVTGSDIVTLAKSDLSSVVSFQSNMIVFEDASNISTAFTPANGTYTFDIHMSSINQQVIVYQNGVLLVQSPLPTSTVTENIIFQCGAVSSFVSQVIVSTDSTLGYHLYPLTPNLQGTHNDWTGGFTELIDGNPTTLVTTDAINSIETWQSTAVTTNQQVIAVVMNIEAQTGTGGPAIAALIQHSSDVALVPLTFSDTQYSVKTAVFSTNPTTSPIWTATALNVSELGIKSLSPITINTSSVRNVSAYAITCLLPQAAGAYRAVMFF